MLTSISHLAPQNEKFLDVEGLLPMAKSYGLNIDDLKAEWKPERKTYSTSHDVASRKWSMRKKIFKTS